MGDNGIYILLGCFLAVCAACILLPAIIHRVRANRPDSPETHDRASRMLKSVASRNGWKLVDRPGLADIDGNVSAGHLLLCPFGMVVIGDIHMRGNYFGSSDSDRWMISNSTEDKPGLRTYVENPFLSAEAFEKEYRKLLLKNRIYNIQSEVLAVRSGEASMSLTGCRDRVVTVSQLKKALGSPKYFRGKADMAAMSALSALKGKRLV